MKSQNLKNMMEKLGDYGVYRFLDISNAHITEKDAEALRSNCGIRGAYLIGTYDEGWILSVSECDDYEGDETFVDCYSTEFYDILAYARLQGAILIRFDADGMEYPDLPTFDW